MRMVSRLKAGLQTLLAGEKFSLTWTRRSDAGRLEAGAPILRALHFCRRSAYGPLPAAVAVLPLRAKSTTVLIDRSTLCAPTLSVTGTLIVIGAVDVPGTAPALAKAVASVPFL